MNDDKLGKIETVPPVAARSSAAERLKDIVRQATKLFVEKGYDRTTVRELAKAMGVSTGYLYNYVKSKNDIVRVVVDFVESMLKDFLATVRRESPRLSATEAIKRTMEALLNMTDENQDWYICIDHLIVGLKKEDQRRIFGAYIALVEHCEGLLSAGGQTGEFQIEDPRLVANEIVTIAFQWATRRWFLRNYTLQNYTRKQTEFILRAISTPSNARFVQKKHKTVGRSNKRK